MPPFVTVSAEIRAPLAAVHAVASRPDRALEWVWPPAQVKAVRSTRDLPDGTRQVVVEPGDKLRDKVILAGERSVIVESERRPAQAGEPGRKLRLELSLEPGPGTTLASLGLSLPGRDAPTAVVEQRRWRRAAEQALQRLGAVAEGG